MNTTDSVLDILVNEGRYRELPKPFKVGAIPFDFTHALVAGERANDLVIVIELRGDAADDAAVRKIMALTRALDVMRSKRPVTAVLTSGQPRTEMVRSISQVCRVLPIGVPTGDDPISFVREWLSVLLPLTQQSAIETLHNWEADLRKNTTASSQGAFMESLVGAAKLGKEAVETILAAEITKSINAVITDEGEQK